MHNHNLPPFFSSLEAASYLIIKENTLRRSRVTGKLFGIAAPSYFKIGKAVRYEKLALELWLKRNSVKCHG